MSWNVPHIVWNHTIPFALLGKIWFSSFWAWTGCPFAGKVLEKLEKLEKRPFSEKVLEKLEFNSVFTLSCWNCWKNIIFLCHFCFFQCYVFMLFWFPSVWFFCQINVLVCLGGRFSYLYIVIIIISELCFFLTFFHLHVT